MLALIGLGDALEAKQRPRRPRRASTARSSICIPARADFRRFAGERLERLGKAQRALIIDTYRRAVEDRPDHLTGHRMLAYALVRDGQYAEAFAAILAGIDQPYPRRPARRRRARARRGRRHDRRGVRRARRRQARRGRRRSSPSAASRSRPGRRRASSCTGRPTPTTSTSTSGTRAAVTRGTATSSCASGGELYADITTGYGPECFAIPGTPKAGPYQLSINYYSQGPMGYGMGLLQIQKFDGKGSLTLRGSPVRDHDRPGVRRSRDLPLTAPRTTSVNRAL